MDICPSIDGLNALPTKSVADLKLSAQSAALKLSAYFNLKSVANSKSSADLELSADLKFECPFEMSVVPG